MLKERKSNLAINGLIGVLAATFVSVFPAGSQNRPYLSMDSMAESMVTIRWRLTPDS